MYRNKATSEQSYSIREVAHLLSKSEAEVRKLMKSGKLAFEVGEFSMVVTNTQLSEYLISITPLPKSIWRD